MGPRIKEVKGPGEGAPKPAYLQDYGVLKKKLENFMYRLPDSPDQNRMMHWLEKMLFATSRQDWDEQIGADWRIRIPTMDAATLKALTDALRGLEGVSIQPPRPNEFNPATFLCIALPPDELERLRATNTNPINAPKPFELAGAAPKVVLNIPPKKTKKENENRRPYTIAVASSLDTPAAQGRNLAPKQLERRMRAAEAAKSKPTEAGARQRREEQARALSKALREYVLPPQEREALPRAPEEERGNEYYSLGEYANSRYVEAARRLAQAAAEIIGTVQNGQIEIYGEKTNARTGEQYFGGMRTSAGIRGWVKSGIGPGGETFILVDEKTYAEVSKNGKFANPAMVKTMPEGGVVLAEGGWEGGKWGSRTTLNLDSPHKALASALGMTRAHLRTLAAQSHFENSPVNGQRQQYMQLARLCGRMDLAQAGRQPDLLVSRLAAGAELMGRLAGPMPEMVARRVGWFSFSGVNVETHFWLIGRKEGTWHVVDASAKNGPIHGEGSTLEKAIEDMSQTGFCRMGAYYWFDKEAGAAPETAREVRQFVAVPAESGLTRFGQASEMLSPVILAGMMSKNPWGLGAAAVGIAAQTLNRIFTQSQIMAHTGQTDWTAGSGLQTAGDIGFFLSIMPGGSGALVRLASSGMGQAAVMGAYGAGGYLAAREARQQEAAGAAGAGRPMAGQGEVPENWASAGETLVWPLYRLEKGKPKMSNMAAAKGVETEWLPHLQAALSMQTPSGLNEEEQAAWQMQILARNARYVWEHEKQLDGMALALGWKKEDVMLEMLMFGGPMVEETEEKTWASVRKLNDEIFLKAALYLTIGAEKAGGPRLDVGQVARHLKLQWIRNEIPASRILEEAGAAPKNVGFG